MNVKDIFQNVIEKGMNADPRGRAGVDKALEREKKRYEEMSDAKKAEYDTEKLTNPYSDSRILCGDLNKEVKRILMGVNIDTGEVVLADRLADKGKPVDLIIAHHPRGKGLAALHGVMDLQADYYNQLGVPINVAEGVMADRIDEVQRATMPADHNQSVDAAKILGIPMMCTHTPSDNIVQKFVQDNIDAANPETLNDVIEVIKSISEYQQAVMLNFGPKIVAGKGEGRCGKVAVKFTGGTEGAKDIYKEVANKGVGTWVCMHMKDDNIKFCKEHHLNVIIAGHMSSDSVGMNMLYKELEDSGVEMIRCSGLLHPDV